MKAIRVTQPGGPEALKIEEIEDLVPDENEIVVGIRAAGVNPVDTYIRSGTYVIKPNCPYTPGMDGAGEVLRVGAKVKKFKAGARVYVAGSKSGTYAEQALCAPDQVHPLPGNVSFAQGAAVFVAYATAYRALFQIARAEAGETVLIHGASGGVGVAAVQLALSHGLTVIGTGGTSRGRKLIEEQGVEYVLDHNQEGYLSDILGATCGRGVDVIVEMLANKNLQNDLTLLAKNGRVVIVGSRGPIEINPRETMSRDAAILGMTVMNTPPDEMASIHAALIAGLRNRSLNPIVGQKIPLSQAPRAHEAVMQSGAYGKIVLIP